MLNRRRQICFRSVLGVVVTIAEARLGDGRRRLLVVAPKEDHCEGTEQRRRVRHPASLRVRRRKFNEWLASVVA
jgi:hypothetical protein